MYTSGLYCSLLFIQRRICPQSFWYSLQRENKEEKNVKNFRFQLQIIFMDTCDKLFPLFNVNDPFHMNPKVVSWEPEGHYTIADQRCSVENQKGVIQLQIKDVPLRTRRAFYNCRSKMFRWEPEGRYCHRLCTAIAPFWFSTDEVCKDISGIMWLNVNDPTMHYLTRLEKAAFNIWGLPLPLEVVWKHISSVESQNGAIAIQRCSVQNQKGAITIDCVQW